MLTKGQRLGEFEIIEPLGKGGMGEVYKARQASLQRFVALKTLQSSLTDDADYIARFRQEALAAAVLSHPNLVQVHSAGESEGLHWFAMEYIEGESAKARLKRKGRLDPREALAIAIHVATALDYGWRKAGLIHRDIKPDNIFLSNDGEVKLGDLGLAKSAGQPQGLTQTGHSMGTPLYMSPEQAEAMGSVDFRADIYSLGCTLYHLLSGLPPYDGASGLAIIMKHANAPVPDLRSVWKECPAPLAMAVAKMMRKDPADRQPSYEEVIADLRRAFASLSQSRVPSVVDVTHQRDAAAKKRRVSLVGQAAGGVALLAALAALLYFAPWKKGGDPGGTRSGVSQTSSALPSPAGSDGRAGARPSDATKDAPFVNTLGMKFVPVPILGGPTGGKTVLFSVWDTRVQDYEAYADAKNADDAWTRQQKDGVPIGRELNHPVVSVSWEDAQGFCQWLTEKEIAEGKLPKGLKYRLPTDEEWSWAVGLPPELGATPAEKDGKNSMDFPWGKGYPPRQKVGNYPDETFHAKFPPKKNEKENRMDDLWIVGYDDGYATTSPVGSFPANAYALYDMGGNVWQWCEDWFDASHKDRVLRGASWSTNERYALLSSFRHHLAPTHRGPDHGFRCVLANAGPASSAPAQTVSTSPATATKDQPFVNGLGMRFVPVPIISGPTAGQRVLFSVWDTRVQDYEAYAGAKKVDDSWTKQIKDGVPIDRELNHPVVGVSWEDAQVFCQWLTEKEIAEGKLPKGLKYRLPTDEEWSWAVGLPPELDATPWEKRGKNSVDYPWGKDYPPRQKVGNYADETFHAKFPLKEDAKDDWNKNRWIEGYMDGYATSSPVGSFPANAHGLYDMGGNVWQWCEDWFDASHKDRVLRGAAWGDSDRRNLLSSSRSYGEPGKRNNSYGFRCVLAPASSPPAEAGTGTPAREDTRPAIAPPAPTRPVGEVEKWLAEVDGPQQAAFQKQVLKPFETGVAELRARYVALLDAAIAKASAAGQLTDALAWRTERQALEQAQNVAADDEATPPGVKTLRAAFRQQFTKLDQERTAQARPLLAAYDAVLAKYETLLTQRQRLDDALLLKTKREEIAKAWLGTSAVITVGTADRPEPAKPVETTTALAATKDQPFVNSLGMKFVPVPIPGGATSGQKVLFSVWDTRVQDYATYAGVIGITPKNPDFEQGPTHPVVVVSWYEAKAFCAWLTARERASGRIGAHDEYRLPSDHEWSCAAGIGEREIAARLPSEKTDRIGDAFPWGMQWPPPKGAGNYAGQEMRPVLVESRYAYIKDLIHGYNDGFVNTSPVGSFAANRFGLDHMGGNVWQWCEDWFDKDQIHRVLRGACWNSWDRGVLLSSHRHHLAPGDRDPDRGGFRCVLGASGR